jgi:hypothetical protein
MTKEFAENIDKWRLKDVLFGVMMTPWLSYSIVTGQNFLPKRSNSVQLSVAPSRPTSGESQA